MSLVNANASSSIGVGTIVGSAVFNILVIIGITTIRRKALILDWKPLVRDCTFYGAAVIGIATTFAGGRVDWWKVGFTLVCTAFILCSWRITNFSCKWICCGGESKDTHGVE